MTIAQVISLAQSGELSQLAVRNKIEDVLGFINLGMIELYKRFPLNVKEHLITLDGSEIYTMPRDYMWIVCAYDEVPENSPQNVIQIPINEENNPLSLNTISWNQIQVPVDTAGSTISIIYTASPISIMYETNTDSFYYIDELGVNQAIVELPLPTQMIEALLHYIGYRGHGAVNGEVQAENNTHYQRFELSCRRIEEMGMFTSDDLSMSGRIHDNGFV